MYFALGTRVPFIISHSLISSVVDVVDMLTIVDVSLVSVIVRGTRCLLNCFCGLPFIFCFLHFFPLLCLWPLLPLRPFLPFHFRLPHLRPFLLPLRHLLGNTGFGFFLCFFGDLIFFSLFVTPFMAPPLKEKLYLTEIYTRYLQYSIQYNTCYLRKRHFLFIFPVLLYTTRT